MRLEPPSEFETKQAQVRSILLERGVDAVILRSNQALSWYLCGARVQVNLTVPAVLVVVVSVQSDRVITSVSEAQRLRDEELPPIDIEEVPWWSSLEEHLPSGRTVLDEDDVSAELRCARASLQPIERDRLRRLGAESVGAVQRCLIEASPDWTELQLAGCIAGSFVELMIDPVVVLVGGYSRQSYRHPLPSSSKLGSRAMVSVCARKFGLYANFTRWFVDESDALWSRRMDSIGCVERSFLEATRVGAEFVAVFRDGCSAYARNGFEPNEWRHHHQGGATGYLGRDPRVTPTTVGNVVMWQPFTWSPSAPGVKVEDTYLVTGEGLELVTRPLGAEFTVEASR